MKVLYLTYDGLTDPLGGSQILPYLVGLSQKGAEITVISCEKKAAKGRIGEVETLCQLHQIKWIAIDYHKSPPVISTLRDKRNMLRCAKKELAKGDYEIIHCRSYITALVGLQLKKKFNLKFVFDMRGFWADERVEGGIWNLGNPIYRWIYNYFKRAERSLLHEADYTISLTGKAAHYLESNFNTSPIQVIPCCVDLDLFDPQKIPTTSRNSFTLGYVGSLGTWYMLKEMLVFFKVLLSREPESSFLIISQDDPSDIFKLARKLEIPENKLVVKRSERSEVPKYIEQMDWCIMFIRPVFSKMASSPTKMGEVMAMNKPIVCNTGVGDMESLLKGSDSGYVVNEFSVEEYRVVVEKICEDSYPQTESRAIAEQELGLDKGVEMYLSVYQNLVQN